MQNAKCRMQRDIRIEPAREREPKAAGDCRIPRRFAQIRCVGRCASFWSAPVPWRFFEFFGFMPDFFKGSDSPHVGCC